MTGFGAEETMVGAEVGTIEGVSDADMEKLEGAELSMYSGFPSIICGTKTVMPETTCGT